MSEPRCEADASLHEIARCGDPVTENVTDLDGRQRWLCARHAEQWHLQRRQGEPEPVEPRKVFPFRSHAGGLGQAGLPPTPAEPPGTVPPQPPSALPTGAPRQPLGGKEPADLLKEDPRTIPVSRRREIVYAARCHGIPWHTIAKWAGKALATVQRDHAHMLRVVTVDDLASLRAELDGQAQLVYQQAVGILTDAQAGDIERAEAGKVALKAIERRARLHGADMPVKIASTTPDGEQYAPLSVALSQLDTEEVLVLRKLRNVRLTPQRQLPAKAGGE